MGTDVPFRSSREMAVPIFQTIWRHKVVTDPMRLRMASGSRESIRGHAYGAWWNNDFGVPIRCVPEFFKAFNPHLADRS